MTRTRAILVASLFALFALLPVFLHFTLDLLKLPPLFRRQNLPQTFVRLGSDLIDLRH